MKNNRFCLFLCLVSFSIFSPAFSAEVSLLEKTEETGMSSYYDSLSGSLTIEKNGHLISFIPGNSYVLKDGSRIIKEKAPDYGENGKLVCDGKFITFLENQLVSEDDVPSYKVGAILIDPGHGGKDPGALMEHTINGKKVTVQEKDINLKTSLYLYDKLKKAYPDKKILMTRNKDVFITLQNRTDTANGVKVGANEAVLYVSIHVNSSLDKNATGYEVWYLSPDYRRDVLEKESKDDAALYTILNSMMEEEYTTESILIAKYITEGIGAQVGKLSESRGIKAEEWFVCKNANMPSVLVELGFLSNAKEAALLYSDDYLKKLSQGIYNGLEAFVLDFENSKGFTGEK